MVHILKMPERESQRSWLRNEVLSLEVRLKECDAGAEAGSERTKANNEIEYRQYPKSKKGSILN